MFDSLAHCTTAAFNCTSFFCPGLNKVALKSMFIQSPGIRLRIPHPQYRSIEIGCNMYTSVFRLNAASQKSASPPLYLLSLGAGREKVEIVGETESERRCDSFPLSPPRRSQKIWRRIGKRESGGGECAWDSGNLAKRSHRHWGASRRGVQLDSDQNGACDARRCNDGLAKRKSRRFRTDQHVASRYRGACLRT